MMYEWCMNDVWMMYECFWTKPLFGDKQPLVGSSQGWPGPVHVRTADRRFLESQTSNPILQMDGAPNGKFQQGNQWWIKHCPKLEGGACDMIVVNKATSNKGLLPRWNFLIKDFSIHFYSNHFSETSSISQPSVNHQSTISQPSSAISQSIPSSKF